MLGFLMGYSLGSSEGRGRPPSLFEILITLLGIFAVITMTWYFLGGFQPTDPKYCKNTSLAVAFCEAEKMLIFMVDWIVMPISMFLIGRYFYKKLK